MGMRVFVDTPAFFIRPTTNTDWRYMRELGRITEHAAVDFLYPFDLRDIFHENAKLISSKVFKKYFAKKEEYWNANPSRDIGIDSVEKLRADVVYSHRAQFPTNLGPKPFVWFHSVADPRMSKANGATDADIEAQYQKQAAGYRLATRVQVTSDVEVARHAAKFPEFSDRFVSVPWFRPGLIAAPTSMVKQKHLDDKRVRLVFVGRQARRKGLDIVLNALRLMSDAERKSLSFDIVTSFSDGPVDLDVDVELRVHREIDNKSLFELMRNAHIYVMPCRFETFGLVFVEAMSHGCGVLAPDWEVQREILDYGRAGINAAPTAEEVCRGLRALCQDREKRTELAEAALQRFEEKYSPKVVAIAYSSMFEMAVAAKERRAQG
jgi:glycosyltransferase involved in cell wall biosynthesis